MRFPLTPYGRREVTLYGGLSFAAAVALATLGPVVGSPVLSVAAVLPLAALAFVLNFFRDPERRPAPEADAWSVLSPADGTVSDIGPVEEPDYVGRAVRIGIFMSPLDVPVNRFPISGEVEYVSRRPGKCLPAYDRRAPFENEAVSMGLLAQAGDPGASGPGGSVCVRLLVRQIAGVAARRIVCPVEVGRRAVRGERFGMIKFGSRCEVYVPASASFPMGVKVGDRVRGGETVLGKLSPAPVPASAVLAPGDGGGDGAGRS